MAKECIHFFRNLEDTRGVEICFNQKKFLDLGNEESMIFRVQTSIVKREVEREVGQMILKVPFGWITENHYCLYPECNKENMMKKYLTLKKLKIPVPPTFRFNKDGDRYLMTDLTENGKKIIIDKHIEKQLPIFIENLEELIENAKQIALKAYKNGIYLSTDAYCITFGSETNSGKGSICILDFAGGSTFFKEDDRQGFNDSLENQAVACAVSFGNRVTHYTLNRNSTMSSGCII